MKLKIEPRNKPFTNYAFYYMITSGNRNLVKNLDNVLHSFGR